MNHKRLNILIIVVSFCVLNLMGQQQPLIGHYMFDPHIVNPGAAGSSERVSALLLVREQWQGFPGAPRTITASVNAPFSLLGMQHGVGLNVVSDAIGFNSDAGLTVSYALRFPLGTGKLGVGLKGGFLNSSLKDAEWKASTENTFQTDPTSFVTEYNDFLLDLDFGIFYRTDDLFFGISSTRLNNPKADMTASSADQNGVKAEYGFVRHYYLTTSYNIYLSNPSFEIRPSFLIRSDGKTMNFDITGMLVYNKKLWTGLAYRKDVTSVAILYAGLELMKDLNLGFSYDIPSNIINEYSQLSFEIFVNYNFTLGGEKITQRYKSIRYL